MDNCGAGFKYFEEDTEDGPTSFPMSRRAAIKQRELFIPKQEREEVTGDRAREI